MSINLPPPEQMEFDTPMKGPDGGVYMKKFVEDEPGTPTEFTHYLGRIPFSITPVWSNKAINFPEVSSSSKDKSVLKFVPDWVTSYTQKKFIVVMRFQ